MAPILAILKYSTINLHIVNSAEGAKLFKISEKVHFQLFVLKCKFMWPTVAYCSYDVHVDYAIFSGTALYVLYM